jgi:hypothetical protein
MKSPLHFLTLFMLWLQSVCVFAQSLPAQIQFKDQTTARGTLSPRKTGTTLLQLKIEDTETRRNIDTQEVTAIQFDLSPFNPGALYLQYQAGNYDAVIDGLKVRINPYFSFVDMETNSNQLVELFIQALYRSGNFPGVHVAGKEVAKYDINGDMRRTADIYRGLSFLKQKNLKKFQPFAYYFEKINRDDPMAAALWMGQSKRAALEEKPDQVYPPLARLITERPMETEWSAEALYLTAVYHHTRTNLVVANQICQEIKIVAPLSTWPARAEKLQTQIRTEAEALNIVLTSFGEFRKADKQAGEAKVDYRERQRALEEQEIQFTE